MEDVLGDIVNNNIKVEIEDYHIICYSAKNTIVTKTLSEISGLILDVCGIISEYYNAVVTCNGSKLLIEDEYINFKKITQSIILQYYGLYHWDFWLSSYLNNATVLLFTTPNKDRSLRVFSEYLEKIYNVKNYFSKYEKPYYGNPPTIKIINKYGIIIDDDSGAQGFIILDPDLFVFLIIMIKKIIEKS